MLFFNNKKMMELTYSDCGGVMRKSMVFFSSLNQRYLFVCFFLTERKKPFGFCFESKLDSKPLLWQLLLIIQLLLQPHLSLWLLASLLYTHLLLLLLFFYLQCEEMYSIREWGPCQKEGVRDIRHQSQLNMERVSHAPLRPLLLLSTTIYSLCPFGWLSSRACQSTIRSNNGQ